MGSDIWWCIGTSRDYWQSYDGIRGLPCRDIAGPSSKTVGEQGWSRRFVLLIYLNLLSGTSTIADWVFFVL